MKKKSRLLVLAVLMPLLVASVPGAQADFLIANPAPDSSTPPERRGSGGVGGGTTTGPVVFDRSRKAREELVEEDNDPGEGEWRENVLASYGLFLLTLIGGHAPPPPPQGPNDPGTVISGTPPGDPGGTPHSNPEPATMVSGLVGGAVLALVYFRKRRYRRAKLII